VRIHCFIGIIFSLWACVASAEIVEFGVNESPPFWSENKAHQGMCGAIMQALSEETGIEAKIYFKPLKRLINDVHNNDIGNPELYMYQQAFVSIIPILSYRSAFYAYQPKNGEKPALQLNSLTDLAQYKVGILKGALIDKVAFEQVGVYFETSYKQSSLFKKLKVGRIDLVLEIDLAAESIIHDLYPELVEDFIKIAVPHSKAVIAIMLSEDLPQAKEIAEKYHKALEKIIKNGRYAEILRAYNKDYNVDTQSLLAELHYFERLYNFSAADE